MRPSRFAAAFVRTTLATLGPVLAPTSAQGLPSPFLGAPEYVGGDVSVLTPAVAADLDGDGLPEYLNYIDNDVPGDVGVLVFANLGGSFAAPVLSFVPMALLGSPQIRVADMDADGALDVLSAKGTQMFRLPGNGDGTLAPYTLAGPVPPDITSFDAVDLDHDGRTDVVMGNFAIGKVPLITVAPGLGDGTLAPAQQIASFPGAAAGFGSIIVHDLDQDGHADLLTQTGGSLFFPTQAVDVLRGTGGWAFQHLPSFKLPSDKLFGKPLALNLDGDDLPDLLFGTLVSGTSQFLLAAMHGTGGGQFAPPILIPVGASFTGEAVDVDLDGCVDIVSGGSAQRLGPGAQPLGAPIEISPPLKYTTWADFDGDALPDAMTLDVVPWPKPALLRRNVLGPVLDLGYGSQLGPTIEVAGTPVANGPATLTVSGPAVGTPALVVLGTKPAHLALGAADLVPSPDVVLAVACGVPLNTRWPSTLQSGTPLYVQAVLTAPSLAVSHALVIVP